MNEIETANAQDADTVVVEKVLRRIVDDVALVVDRPFALEQVNVSRDARRPAGKEHVHISFKLELQRGDAVSHGCLLVPLPDAIALACYLMMVPDDDVEQRRSAKDLDQATKDALVEVDNFVGGATDAALRRIAPGTAARGVGCQGVRADVRPAFPYEEGQPLLVGRAQAKLHTYAPFEMLLVLPEIEGVTLDD